MTKSRGIYKRHPYERLMERCERDPGSGCLLWTGPVNHGGYGRIYDYRVRRYVQNHRLAYEHEVGPIPAGLTLDHLCRNTRCVDVGHLEPCTLAENLRRAGAATTHCKRGHAFDADNTHTYEGRRYCRACSRERYMGRKVVSARAATALDR
jgi:hypothetical protein